MMTDLVIIQNQQAVTSSRIVAEKFNKLHKNVLASIKEILAAENSATKFFKETKYLSRGKKYIEYFMNRDGFMLLVMGFTGKAAMDIKIAYINAFNEMEARLRELQKPKQLPLLEQVKPAVEYVRPYENVEYMQKLEEVKAYINAAKVLTDNLTQTRSLSEHQGALKLMVDILWKAGFNCDGLLKVNLPTYSKNE